MSIRERDAAVNDKPVIQAFEDRRTLLAALDALVEAAEKEADAGPDALRRWGIVFDKWPPANIPAEGWTKETIAALDPETRWQGVAFSIYTSLVLGLRAAIAAAKEASDG